jgi:ArsR family transcriptional regulator
MNPVKFFKCLADETRLRCLLLIEHEQELCVCEITEALDEIQPKISRHLAQLRECGILIDRRQGQWVFYRVNQALPDWAKSVLKKTHADNKTFLAKNLRSLNRMVDRPERDIASC